MRKTSKKLGKGEGGWEKKIQKQGGKCREETDEMDRRKWMGSVEREQTRGRRRGMDPYNSDRLRNSERRSMGRSRRIHNRKESFEEAKGRKEQRRKGRGGG
jgi:hypothetical protein